MKILSRIVLAALLAVPLSAAAQEQPRFAPLRAPAATQDPVPGNVPLNSLAGYSPDYKIGANDLLEIEVYGVSDLKRTVRVNPSGLISLALVGQVTVGGLTAQEAEVEISRRYQEKYLQDPQIAVFIREFTTQRVTIEGAVARPGIYPINGQITLLRAIALAGGGVQLSDFSEVAVFRTEKSGASSTVNFDVEKIRAGAIPDPPVQPDDVIVVRRDKARVLIKDSILRDIVDTINPFSIFTR